MGGFLHHTVILCLWSHTIPNTERRPAQQQSLPVWTTRAPPRTPPSLPPPRTANDCSRRDPAQVSSMASVWNSLLYYQGSHQIIHKIFELRPTASSVSQHLSSARMGRVPRNDNSYTSPPSPFPRGLVECVEVIRWPQARKIALRLSKCCPVSLAVWFSVTRSVMRGTRLSKYKLTPGLSH
jgi:hypothetical protein